MKVWKSSDAGPAASDLAEIVSFLKDGKVLILPTDTVYGYHARAGDEKAIEQIHQVKGRDGNKQLIVLASSFDALLGLGVRTSRETRDYLTRTWPAPLTAILETAGHRAAGPTTIAARVPALEWLVAVLAKTGPLLSSSVNKQGNPPLDDPRLIEADLLTGVAGMVDSGALQSQPSTLVDFTAIPPRVLRQGRFEFRQNLWKTMRKTL